MNSSEFYKDILKLQRDWQKLFNSKQMTKKAIVELCVPFRDKYNLTDKQTLCVARDELSKQELLDILESKGKE